jgi:hypothetical protein
MPLHILWYFEDAEKSNAIPQKSAAISGEIVALFFKHLNQCAAQVRLTSDFCQFGIQIAFFCKLPVLGRTPEA